MLQLHDYQGRAIDFAMEQRMAFLMMDMGLGKTAVALKIIERLKRRAIVVAPLQPAWLVWPQEIQKWTPQLTWTVLHGKSKSEKVNKKKDIYIVPYSSLKWLFHTLTQTGIKIPKTMLVLDESSFIKDGSTQRFKMLKKMHLLFYNFKLLLSASPAPNGYHELWSQFFMLDKGERLGKSFYSFRQKYFTYTGPPTFKTCPLKGSTTKIHEKIGDVTFRLDAEDYIKLPPITYNKIGLRLAKSLTKQYLELEKNFLLKIKENLVVAQNAAGLSSKLRQFLQGGMYINEEKDFEKIHTIKLAMLQELIDANYGKPILGVINFRFEYEMMKNRFKNPPIVYGGTPMDDKKKYINDWNKGKIPLLLAHPASMGHGLNLQSGGTIIIWLALPWSLDFYNQLNGRIWRQGQKNAVVVNNFVFENTIDEVVEKTLKRKNATQRDLLDALKEYTKGRV